MKQGQGDHITTAWTIGISHIAVIGLALISQPGLPRRVFAAQ